MIVLRLLGVMNAAAWFGAAVLFTCGIIPATYSSDMKLLLTERSFTSYSGIIDQIYWDRFLALQIWCGVIALVLQLAEWLYLGRRLQRATTWLVLALLGLTLAGGFIIQPKVQRLHQVKFAYRATPQGYQGQNYSLEQRGQAVRSLQVWEPIYHGLNWLALVGVAVLLWRISNPVDTPRFVPAAKFRG